MKVDRKPRGRQRDAALSERRREEILDAAALAFAQRGFAGTEMQSIADAVGVSKGALYHYFPGKEAPDLPDDRRLERS